MPRVNASPTEQTAAGTCGPMRSDQRSPERRLIKCCMRTVVTVVAKSTAAAAPVTPHRDRMRTLLARRTVPSICRRTSDQIIPFACVAVLVYVLRSLSMPAPQRI